MSAYDRVALAAREAAIERPWRLPEAWRLHLPMGRFVRGVVALVVAYYAAAHLGYALGFSGPVAAIVWLPVGVAVAFLYLGGLSLWPAVVIGDLLVNDYSALPVGTALVQSLGNLCEVLLATVLLRRLCPRKEPVGSLPGVGGMVVAIAAGTLLSATVGSLSSWLGGVINGQSLLHVWRTWWLGDFSGALIVVPLVLAWSTFRVQPWRRGRLAEAVLMVVVVTGLSAVQLGRPMLLVVLVFPALIWAALSFGLQGATVASTIVGAFAIWGSTNDLGPFAVGSINARLLGTQLFIATVSLTALAIAALVAERARLADGVRASRGRLVAASDQAQQRLERDLHDGAQQGLIGLQLRLAQTADVIAEDPGEGRRMVAVIGRQMDAVLEELRSIAHGAYPPVLRDYGIVAALTEDGRHSPVPVAVHGADVRRCSPAVEAAVYFSCREALQNVSKHAGSDACVNVRMRQHADDLDFEVSDSGRGFDADNTPAGNGLANMRDRIEAVGGTLSVASRPGSGTTVRGRVPVS